MMKSTDLGIFLLVFGLVFIWCIADYLGWRNGKEAAFREAISRGYAEYCPKEDDFAWKGECK